MDTTIKADLKVAVDQLEDGRILGKFKEYADKGIEPEMNEQIQALRETVLDLLMIKLDGEKVRDDFDGASHALFIKYSEIMITVLVQLT